MQISEAKSSSIIVIVPKVFLQAEPLCKAGSSILIHVGFDTPEGPYVVYPGYSSSSGKVPSPPGSLTTPESHTLTCPCPKQGHFSSRVLSTDKQLVNKYKVHLSVQVKIFQTDCYFACWNSQMTPADAYLEKFNFAMAQFFQAVSGIVAIFSYMVRKVLS